MTKYKIYLLIYLILAISTVGITKAIEMPLMGKIIYLDAGHGGKDPGALYRNIKESDINLEITFAIEQELSKLGAIVYLTRDGDYDLSTTTINRKRSDLEKKVKMINESDADIYLSIHLNSVTSSTWYGAQVFYDDINEENEKIAEILQSQLKKDLQTRRKHKEIKDIYLNRHVKTPGVLLEVGFLSNPNERYLLRNRKYQEKLAKSLVAGVIKYFS